MKIIEVHKTGRITIEYYFYDLKPRIDVSMYHKHPLHHSTKKIKKISIVNI